MEREDFDHACAKFTESQAVDPAPGTALNLGECEERRGRLVEAHRAFATAAATFTSTDKRRFAAERAEAADQRTPRLIVRAREPVDGLTARVGDEPIALGAEVKLNPGRVVVLVEAPGRRPKALRAELRESRTVELEIGHLALAASAESTLDVDEAPEAEGGGVDLRTLGLVVGGVGVASVAVGAVTGILTLDRAGTVKERCTPDLVCDSEGLEAARSGSTLSTVSTVTIVAGSAAIAGGALLYFLAPRAANGGASGAGARITPTASYGGAGLLVHGSF